MIQFIACLVMAAQSYAKCTTTGYCCASTWWESSCVVVVALFRVLLLRAELLVVVVRACLLRIEGAALPSTHPSHRSSACICIVQLGAVHCGVWATYLFERHLSAITNPTTMSAMTTSTPTAHMMSNISKAFTTSSGQFSTRHGIAHSPEHVFQ
jgi:uncharacterized membrane protein YhdT